MGKAERGRFRGKASGKGLVRQRFVADLSAFFLWRDKDGNSRMSRKPITTKITDYRGDC
jgi:hypothetical protein